MLGDAINMLRIVSWCCVLCDAVRGTDVNQVPEVLVCAGDLVVDVGALTEGHSRAPRIQLTLRNVMLCDVMQWNVM
jgi:hypothetical protein